MNQPLAIITPNAYQANHRLRQTILASHTSVVTVPLYSREPVGGPDRRANNTLYGMASTRYNIDMLDVTTVENAVILRVKVVPGSSRTRYLGEWQRHARIAVAAPAEKGKANKTLTAFLAKLLGLHKRDVTVISGHISAIKTVRIERVTAATLLAALTPARS